MKIADLLQEQTTFEIGKSINAELREMAAQLDLTWGEMPGFVKKGAWYGGFITAKGGAAAERKRGIGLPFSARAKAFFKLLKKFLAQKQENGCEVTVAANTTRNGTFHAMTPSQIESELDSVKMVRKDKVSATGDVSVHEFAKCRWYISFNAEQFETSSFIRITTNTFDEDLWLQTDIACLVSAEQLKTLRKRLKEIALNTSARNGLVHDLISLWHEAGGIAKELPEPPSLSVQVKSTVEQVLNALSTLGSGKQLTTHIAIISNVMAKSTIKVPTDKVLEIIDKWWRKT